MCTCTCRKCATSKYVHLQMGIPTHTHEYLSKMWSFIDQVLCNSIYMKCSPTRIYVVARIPHTHIYTHMDEQIHIMPPQVYVYICMHVSTY